MAIYLGMLLCVYACVQLREELCQKYKTYTERRAYVNVTGLRGLRRERPVAKPRLAVLSYNNVVLCGCVVNVDVDMMHFITQPCFLVIWVLFISLACVIGHFSFYLWSKCCFGGN